MLEDMAADTRTREERENLMKSTDCASKAFKPQFSKTSAVRKSRPSMLKIECSQFLESTADQTTHGYPTLAHRLWLEAGKHSPKKPSRPDPQHNNNVWRNFKQAYGFETEKGGQNMNDVIADMYPVNIPPPSRIGKYTYGRFLTETPIIKDAKFKQLAIRRVEEDMTEFKRMRLHSEVRNPPLDERGDIVPPVNFKRYSPRYLPPLSPGGTDTGMEATMLDETFNPDIFGQQIPPDKARSPLLWKISYRSNHPNVDSIARDMYHRKLRHAGIRVPATK